MSGNSKGIIQKNISALLMVLRIDTIDKRVGDNIIAHIKTLEKDLIADIKKQRCHSCGEIIGDIHIYKTTWEHSIEIKKLIGDNQ